MKLIQNISGKIAMLSIASIIASCNSYTPPDKESYKVLSVMVYNGTVDYVLEDFIGDGKVDVIRSINHNIGEILYKDTSVYDKIKQEYGKHIGSFDFDKNVLPMTPGLIEAATRLKNAYEDFMYEKDLDDYTAKGHYFKPDIYGSIDSAVSGIKTYSK